MKDPVTSAVEKFGEDVEKALRSETTWAEFGKKPEAKSDMADDNLVAELHAGIADKIERKAFERVCAERDALQAELKKRNRSASDRLHNICKAIQEEADGSEFSREEWDRIDAENVTLHAEIRALKAQPQPEGQHIDDEAVDKLATAMKAKLARKRAEGYSGWETSEGMHEHLSNLLRQHVEKGDPVDVANFAAFLHCRGERIAPSQQEARVQLSAELGTAILVDHTAVAWFAELDEYAEAFCRTNWYGRWMPWQAMKPNLIPLTPTEYAEAQRKGKELHAKLRFKDDAQAAKGKP